MQAARLKDTGDAELRDEPEFGAYSEDLVPTQRTWCLDEDLVPE